MYLKTPPFYNKTNKFVVSFKSTLFVTTPFFALLYIFKLKIVKYNKIKTKNVKHEMQNR